MDDVTALTILVSLLVGIGIGWYLRAEIHPILVRWLDHRAARGR